MELSSIAGIGLGTLLLVAAVVLGKAPLSIFVDYSALLCVGGGTVCAVLIGFPLRAWRLLPRTLLQTLLVPVPNADSLIEQIVSLAETARRDGLLSLEHRLTDIPHPLLQRGMQLAVDGIKPKLLHDILCGEIETISSNQSMCKAMLDQLGKYAPAFGMIGTMLGLVMMLNNMSDPSAIGSGMAVALLTTLYGAILANLFCLPLSQKLAFRQQEELKSLELIVRGVTAIQAGEHPRLLEQKLTAMLRPDLRQFSRAA